MMNCRPPRCQEAVKMLLASCVKNFGNRDWDL